MKSDHALFGRIYREARALGAGDATALELVRQCAADLYPALAAEAVQRQIETIAGAVCTEIFSRPRALVAAA